jgi:hypothetical protein
MELSPNLFLRDFGVEKDNSYSALKISIFKKLPKK